MLYRKLYALSTYSVKVSGSYTILKLLKQLRATVTELSLTQIKRSMGKYNRLVINNPTVESQGLLKSLESTQIAFKVILSPPIHSRLL